MPEEARRPNIILIFTDQQRADTFGFANDPVAQTPHADWLASQGVVFSNCCASSPVCMTARASLASATHVHQHGVWGYANPALRHGVSHVRNTRDAGYHTAVIGKAHLFGHDFAHTHDHQPLMRDWGYEHVDEMTGPTESMHNDSPYTDYLADQGLLDVHREYLRTYHRGHSGRLALPWELPPCLLPTEAHLDMFIAERGAKWIRDYDRSEPFYLQLCFGGPHDPWDAPAEYRRRYDADEIPLSITAKQEGPVAPLVEMLKTYAAANLDGMSAAQNRVMKSYYYAKVSLIDDAIAKVLRALEAGRSLDDTWIIFSADHGEMLGDHGLIAKKAFYEGALKVPLVIRPPGGTEGRSSDVLADHLDIAGTIMAIADAAPIEESPGRSLLPMIDGATKHRDAVLSENQGFEPYSMVRTTRYKMSVDTRTRLPVDLYDLVDDPLELHNRVADPSFNTIIEELTEGPLAELLATLDPSKLPDSIDPPPPPRGR